MKNQIQGWRTTLLFVLLFWLGAGLSGCSGRARVYTAGVREQETREMPDARMEEAELFGSDDGAEVLSPETTETKLPGSGAAGKESAGAEPESEGYVYVCGAVARPGVYPMYEGMRVFEALELAGGFARDADQEWLNQAELLQDGQRLYVYTQEETRAIEEGKAAGTAAGQADGKDSEKQKVNLNTADREQLKTLPGIGDAKADAIVQYREEHGPFGSIEEIQNISGIKSGMFSKIRDLITV